MPIYKYTLIKYAKSLSTWIPLVVSIFVVISLGVIMPFTLIGRSLGSAANKYQLYLTMSITVTITSTCLFSAIFAAYKTTQIYKQEIEDGTLLVLISKPITKRRILIEKWCALLSVLLIYALSISLIYCVLVAIFDPGSKIINLSTPTLKSIIFPISLIFFFLVFIMSIFFSALAFLISSKFSSASTIAALGGIGALIPTSGIIPVFTLKNDYQVLTNNIVNQIKFSNMTSESKDFLTNLQNSTININDFSKDSLDKLESQLKNNLYIDKNKIQSIGELEKINIWNYRNYILGLPPKIGKNWLLIQKVEIKNRRLLHLTTILEDEKNSNNQSSEFNIEIDYNDEPKYEQETIKKVYDSMNKATKTMTSSKYLNNLSVFSGETNSYKSLFALDFNYQLNEISSIATKKLWGDVDYYSYTNTNFYFSTSNAAMTGKKKVVENNIETSNIISKIDETMNEYKKIMNSNYYNDLFSPVFNIILNLNGIILEKEDNFEISLQKLLLKILEPDLTNPNNQKINMDNLIKFILRPIFYSVEEAQKIGIITNSQFVEINDRKKSLYYEIKKIEKIAQFKLMMEIGYGNKLVFLSSEIKRYYQNNDIDDRYFDPNFISDNNKKELEEIVNSNDELKELINKHFVLPGKNNLVNYSALADIVNIIQLKNDEFGNVNIVAIKYEPYADPWALIGIYSSLVVIIVPISYVVINRQNIR